MIIDESELVYGELSYERRITAFFDVLGWRSEIQQAGTDPRRIARLASVVRLFNAQIAAARSQLPGAFLTSFSDNVVFSVPYEADQLLWTLQGVATVQFGLALQGFWLRGGITVGDLYHDDLIVFGPSLVRAHHLESEIAHYPRVLIDPEINSIDGPNDFVAVEGDEVFLDPFRAEFYDRIQSDHPVNPDVVAAFNAQSDFQIPRSPLLVPGSLALGAALERMEHEMRSAQSPTVFEKHAWWFDRIAARLGLSVRSADVVGETAGHH